LLGFEKTSTGALWRSISEGGLLDETCDKAEFLAAHLLSIAALSYSRSLSLRDLLTLLFNALSICYPFQDVSKLAKIYDLKAVCRKKKLTQIRKSLKVRNDRATCVREVENDIKREFVRIQEIFGTPVRDYLLNDLFDRIDQSVSEVFPNIPITDDGDSETKSLIYFMTALDILLIAVDHLDLSFEAVTRFILASARKCGNKSSVNIGDLMDSEFE
jgi:hypothetical protein